MDGQTPEGKGPVGRTVRYGMLRMLAMPLAVRIERSGQDEEPFIN